MFFMLVVFFVDVRFDKDFFHVRVPFTNFFFNAVDQAAGFPGIEAIIELCLDGNQDIFRSQLEGFDMNDAIDAFFGFEYGGYFFN